MQTVIDIASRCADNEFECSTTGRCVAYEETCDGVPDCPNKEDEQVDFCGKSKSKPQLLFSKVTVISIKGV